MEHKDLEQIKELTQQNSKWENLNKWLQQLSYPSGVVQI